MEGVRAGWEWEVGGREVRRGFSRIPDYLIAGAAPGGKSNVSNTTFADHYTIPLRNKSKMGQIPV